MTVTYEIARFLPLCYLVSAIFDYKFIGEYFDERSQRTELL